jgi:hypothetical protein
MRMDIEQDPRREVRPSLARIVTEARDRSSLQPPLSTARGAGATRYLTAQ